MESGKVKSIVISAPGVPVMSHCPANPGVALSTAFATPVASPVNALVLGPGGYRFGDFLKAGVALQVVVLALGAVTILLLWS